MKSRDNVDASTSTPTDPAVVEVLEEFVSAPNFLDAMIDRLANPATPTTVRQMISDILHIGQILGTQQAVA